MGLIKKMARRKLVQVRKFVVEASKVQAQLEKLRDESYAAMIAAGVGKKLTLEEEMTRG